MNNHEILQKLKRLLGTDNLTPMGKKTMSIHKSNTTEFSRHNDFNEYFAIFKKGNVMSTQYFYFDDYFLQFELTEEVVQRFEKYNQTLTPR